MYFLFDYYNIVPKFILCCMIFFGELKCSYVIFLIIYQQREFNRQLNRIEILATYILLRYTLNIYPSPSAWLTSAPLSSRRQTMSVLSFFTAAIRGIVLIKHRIIMHINFAWFNIYLIKDCNIQLIMLNIPFPRREILGYYFISSRPLFYGFWYPEERPLPMKEQVPYLLKLAPRR